LEEYLEQIQLNNFVPSLPDMAATKTNAARLLDSQGIKYELLAYEVDESDLSAIAV
jgi:hypothetical protein